MLHIAKLPVAFYMDNSTIASDPRAWTVDDRARAQLDWSHSMAELARLLHTVGTLVTVFHASVLEDVRTHRNRIKEAISKSLNEMEKLDQLQEMIGALEQESKQAQLDTEQYKDFKKQEVVEYCDTPATTTLNTLCQDCRCKGPKACHQNCSLEELPRGSADFIRCACLHNTGGKCRSCGCPAASHYHARHVFVKRVETIDTIVADLKAKYDAAQGTITSTSQQRATHAQDVAALRAAAAANQAHIQSLCEELHAKCRGFNFVDEFHVLLKLLKTRARRLTTVEARDAAERQIRALTKLIDTLSHTAPQIPAAATSTAPPRRTGWRKKWLPAWMP